MLVIDYKEYVYVMVCIYPFLSDHTQYVHSPTFSCIYARAVGPFGISLNLCNWVWCRVAEIIAWERHLETTGLFVPSGEWCTNFDSLSKLINSLLLDFYLSLRIPQLHSKFNT